jgi:archaellum component FlaF (FlaF/FlaG flagellin family)
MKIYNESDKPVVVNRVQAPAHVKLSLTDGTSLKPKDSVEVTITYDGSKVNDWDFVHDNITLMTDDTDRAEKRLYVSAKIQEDFSKMTSADSLAAPRAEFNTLSWDFGNIKATESVSYDFVVKNIGKKELLIRKVKASCGCTATNPDKTNLAPGESTNIKVTFNPAGKSGQQQKSVTVVTNDPFQSSVNLMIKSNIQTEEGKPAATPAAPAHDHSGHDHSGHNH